jgi:parvulin-like peptidyl-prolyl isomerase
VEGEAAQRARQNPAELLERLVNIRLIRQEALNIGLDELPQVRKAVEAYRLDALRQLLFRRATRDINEVAPEEIEDEYRASVKEVRVRSLLIPAEEDASRLDAEVRDGGDFARLALELTDAGKAEMGDEVEFLKDSEFLPSVREVVSGLKPGEVSGPVDIGDEYAMLELLEVRYPEDPATRRKLEEKVLARKRTAALREYTDELKEKYAKVDEALFESLDYEAPEPGFDVLLEDERVLAEIDGAEPVRVKELSQLLRQEIYHGVERAAEAKRVNARKDPLLDRALRRAVVLREAEHLGLDRTDEYAFMMEEFENGMIFQAFLEKVVNPDVRLSREDLERYLAEHQDEFSSPEMMRLDSLAFSGAEAAEAALGQLREGTDFLFVRANAEDRLDPETEEELLEFPEHLVVTSAFPEGVGQAVAGADAGDYRLYLEPEGPAYVLRVRDVVPPVPEPFDAVKGTLAKRVFAEKQAAALDGWIEQLRAASEIEIHATAEVLERMLGGAMAEGP